AERLDDERERPLELQLESLGIDGLEVIRCIHELGTEAFPFRPALDRGDTVLRRDGRPVAELQPVTEMEGVRKLVRTDVPTGQHLRLVMAIAVDRHECVKHQISEDARRIDRCDDGVENLKLGLKRDLQYAIFGMCGPGNTGGTDK